MGWFNKNGVDTTDKEEIMAKKTSKKALGKKTTKKVEPKVLEDVKVEVEQPKVVEKKKVVIKEKKEKKAEVVMCPICGQEKRTKPPCCR